MDTGPVTTNHTTPVIARARGTGLIVISSVCFGTSGVLAKAALNAGLTAAQVASVRVCVAAVTLLVGTVLVRRSALVVPRRQWPALVAYGIVGVALVQLLYFVAVSRLPVGVALLLEYTSPVLVTLWVRLVRRVRLPALVWCGVGLAVTGLVLVAQVWHGMSLDTVGVVAGLGTAASAAVYFLLGERAVATGDPVGMTAWGLAIGAVVMLVVTPPWTIPVDTLSVAVPLGPLRPPLWALLAALVLISTVVAYLTGMAALRHLPSSVASVLSMLELVVATTLAWLWLGQPLSPVQVAGGVILLSGAVIVQVRSPAAKATTPESPSARSSAGADTSPPPTGPPPAAPPARSGECR